MTNWPRWLPSPNAWMSAVLLTLLMNGITIAIYFILQLANAVNQISPRWGLVLAVLAILSPIVLIAIVHHLLHAILDRFFPDIRSPEVEPVQGLLPNLMSWWEGLYGWVVIVVAGLISFAILGNFLTPTSQGFNLLQGWWPSFQLFNIWEKIGSLVALPTLIWLIVSAYLYQFEQTVRQHLIAVGANQTRRA